MPYMYTEECLEFRADFVHHIVGTVRVIAPEEEMLVLEPSVCIDVDMFYLHLSESLEPLAREQFFHQSECVMCDDAVKTTAGGKSYTLLSRMAHTTQRWAQNMQGVLSLMEAQVAYETACPFAVAYDEAKGVVTPRHGFENELAAAVHKAVTDKAVLQHSMAALRQEFCKQSTHLHR